MNVGSFVFLGLLLCGALGAEPPPAGSWFAEFDQSCDGVEVCGFHLEIWSLRGRTALAVADVDGGCGSQRIDISSLVGEVLAQAPSEEVYLRVWSVSCDGVRSADEIDSDGRLRTGYDWALIDLRGICGAAGTGSALNGDANRNDQLDIGDAITIIDTVFGGDDWPCGDGDRNDDGLLDLADAIAVLEEIFGESR